MHTYTFDPKTTEALSKPITEEEIEATLKTMDPKGTPGPDGITIDFIKTFKKKLFHLYLI